MKLTNPNNGAKFGKLGVKVTNQVQYTLAANEQAPFKGFFYNGIFNVIRRTREKFLYFGVPTVIGYWIYVWGENKNMQLQRKNPKDFENDV